MKITYCSLLILTNVWSSYKPNLAQKKLLTMFSNCRRLATHPVLTLFSQSLLLQIACTSLRHKMHCYPQDCCLSFFSVFIVVEWLIRLSCGRDHHQSRELCEWTSVSCFSYSFISLRTSFGIIHTVIYNFLLYCR